MPLISYLCSCGSLSKKYVKSAKDAADLTACAKCGKEAKRTLGETSSSYKITIDNGVNARAVEILPDIGEINEERSARDYTDFLDED